MTEMSHHADARVPRPTDRGTERQLVIGTLEDTVCAARTLEDLHLAGFTSDDVALVARVDGAWRPEAAAAERFRQLRGASTIACRGLGTLLVGGEAVPSLRRLEAQVAIGDLGQAFADAGLPDADALIYELGLIRGQCLLAVRAASAERGRVAYRLLLRSGSQEIHVYRP